MLGMKEEANVKRRLYTHNQLLGTAGVLMKQAEGDAEFSNALASVMFCALALEAALNYIGSAKFEVWDKHLQKKLSPEDKLALIASYSQYKICFGKRPFQAFRALFEVRNQLAHGKSQDLAPETAKHWLVYGDRHIPAAQWETLCTATQAKALLEDTQAMIKALHKASGVEAVPSFLVSERVTSPNNALQPPGPASGG